MRRRSSLAAAAAALALLASAGGGLAAQRESASPPGAELVLRATAAGPSGDALERSVAIMRARMSGLGLRGSVATRGPARVLLRLDGASLAAAERDAPLLDGQGRVAFYDITPSLLGASIDAAQNAVAATSLSALLAASPARSGGGPVYLFERATGALLAGPAATPAALLARFHGRTPAGTLVRALPARSTVVTCAASFASVCPGVTAMPQAHVTYYYLFKDGVYPGEAESPYPQLTGADLVARETRAGVGAFAHEPMVLLRFTPRGAALFQNLTRAEAQRGQALGVPQSFAIVVDGRLYSFPAIDEAQYPDGIDPRPAGAEISGLVSAGEAARLALLLRTGPLPARFALVGARPVG